MLFIFEFVSFHVFLLYRVVALHSICFISHLIKAKIKLENNNYKHKKQKHGRLRFTLFFIVLYLYLHFVVFFFHNSIRIGIFNKKRRIRRSVIVDKPNLIIVVIMIIIWSNQD